MSIKHFSISLLIITLLSNHNSAMEQKTCWVLAEDDLDYTLAQCLDLKECQKLQTFARPGSTYYTAPTREDLCSCAILPIKSYYWLLLRGALINNALPLFEILLFKPFLSMQQKCSEHAIPPCREPLYQQRLNLLAANGSGNGDKKLAGTKWNTQELKEFHAAIAKSLSHVPAFQSYLQMLNDVPDVGIPNLSSLLVQTIIFMQSSFLELLLTAGAHPLHPGMLPFSRAMYEFAVFDYNESSKELDLIIKRLLSYLKLPLLLEDSSKPFSYVPAARNAKIKDNIALFAILHDDRLFTRIPHRICELLNQGADPNYCPHKNYDTMLIKAMNRDRPHFVRTLLAYGAKADMPGLDNRTPLQKAIIKNDFRMICMLLYYKAQVNRATSGTYPPLAQSCISTAPYVTKLLLCYGADVNGTGPLGATALHTALNKNNLAAAQYLLEGGASVNMHDGTGTTPLHLVALGSNDQFLSRAAFLIGHGANCSLRDVVQQTPRDMAKKAGKTTIEHYLETAQTMQHENWCNQWRSAKSFALVLHARCGANSFARHVSELPTEKILSHLNPGAYYNNPSCVVPLTAEQLETLNKQFSAEP